MLGAFGEEITLDDSLLLKQTEDAFLFRVPNSKGELGVALPRDEVKQIVGTNSFSTNIRREAEYQVVNLKTPGAEKRRLKGEALLGYFSEPYYKGLRRVGAYDHLKKRQPEKRRKPGRAR